MINPGILLRHYKRPDIQAAMVAAAQHREVSFRFGNKGFGKRPDILVNPGDILQLAKQGTTSFHVSEEHWRNPLQLAPTLKLQELNELRSGWDLVLDIDCKYWEYAKVITHLLIEELKAHNITSVSVKFSGSKGFHIGVPFKAFPRIFKSKPIALHFPEAPKRISLYLKDKIEPKLIKYLTHNKTLEELAQELNKESIQITLCTKCGAEQPPVDTKTTYICPQCQKKIVQDKEDRFKLCPNCKTIEMQKIQAVQECKKCTNKTFETKLDLGDVLEIDTILISSRHLYRMPFSLHEKTSLVSLPIPPESVMMFEKIHALPSKATTDIVFLDDSQTQVGEASELLFSAYEFKPIIKKEDFSGEFKKEFDIPEQALPIDLFPPCIQAGLTGMQDGKKRFMFALMNFLGKVGWNIEQIEELLFAWNEKNLEKTNEQLREVIIRGQLNNRKQTKKQMLPPNCMSYYQDLGVCSPDRLCQKIKNPVQYSTRKAFILNLQENSGRQKLTEEQREMRRKFREKQKLEKEQQESSTSNESVTSSNQDVKQEHESTQEKTQTEVEQHEN